MLGIAVHGGVVAIVLSTVTAPVVHARPRAADQPETTVTLVSGDEVVLVGGEPREVRPGPGRDGIAFSVTKAPGHLNVVPADAITAVAQGRVDARLFDVTTLREFGYDRRDTVPLIVTGPGASRVAGQGRALPSIDGYAYEAVKGPAWRQLTKARDIDRIRLDGKRKALPDHDVPRTGAPSAGEAGYTGAGVRVAVIDTGVDQPRPDLAEADFTASPDTTDHIGHGTRTASAIAAAGATGARILDARVLDDTGHGLDSWIIAGMEWAAGQGADIATLSLDGADTPELDPLEEAVNTLSADHGTLFVTSAGGDATAALTVGAGAGRGRRTGDSASKPDVAAPSGTSMAAAHVAGAAALLAQRHPGHTGARLKAILSGSAKPDPALTAFDQGAGRIDVTAAITQSVITEPAGLDLGTVQWPHHDDVPVSKPLTYRNLGDTDATLTLAIESAAPAGMFTLSANEITVAAGGSAEVTVTGDAGAGDTDGYFTAAVVATRGRSVTRTQVALHREEESYDLTINTIDSTGVLASDYTLWLWGFDVSYQDSPYDEDGSVELRVPRGTYALDTTVIEGTDEDPHYSRLVRPHLVVDKDTTVTADARATKPISITPPSQADLLLGDIGYTLTTEQGGGFDSAFLITDLSEITTAHLGERLPGTMFTAKINTQWTGEDGSFYGLAWFPHGGVPTGFTKVVTKRDVGSVRATFGSPTPGSVGTVAVLPAAAKGGSFTFFRTLEVALPGARTEYVTTGNVRWQSYFGQHRKDYYVEARFTSPYRQYRAGGTYRTSFNQGAFTPAFTNDGVPGGWVYRYPTYLHVGPPLFSDTAGNTGFSTTTGESIELYRDGVLVDATSSIFGDFAMPATSHDYRVVVTATRPTALFDVSTAITAEWTFRSAFADGNTAHPVPVSALRFTPRLDANNSARAGVPFLVPVSLQHNETGAFDRPRTLTVEVSYDRGTTWKRVPTILNLVAVLHHPTDAGTVSLRATATDRNGSGVTETILDVYKLRRG